MGTEFQFVLSRVWLCDPMDCNMPGSSVHGIFQARILEWVAISSSRISSWPKDQTHVSCISSTSRWILHHWATWEASLYTHTHIFRFFSVFTSVQLLSRVRLCVTPWTARQASLSITNSQNLLKLMSIKAVIIFNHLILCGPLLLPSIFPSIRVFIMSQFFTSGGQSIGVSASASVLPMNIQDYFL